MNTERLLILADHLDKLETIPPSDRSREFDMSTWWFCGAAACALGEATQLPVFQKEGLGLRGPDANIPAYENRMGLEAATVFFDINAAQARKIFLPVYYFGYHYRDITPRMVADRIRKVAASEVRQERIREIVAEV